MYFESDKSKWETSWRKNYKVKGWVNELLLENVRYETLLRHNEPYI